MATNSISPSVSDISGIVLHRDKQQVWRVGEREREWGIVGESGGEWGRVGEREREWGIVGDSGEERERVGDSIFTFPSYS